MESADSRYCDFRVLTLVSIVTKLWPARTYAADTSVIKPPAFFLALFTISILNVRRKANSSRSKSRTNAAITERQSQQHESTPQTRNK